LRSGHHATVYEVRRDPELKNKNIIRDSTKKVFPFVSGSQYKGMWEGDSKCGFGIQTNADDTKYEGEWQDGKYQGRGTLWIKKGKSFVRQYVGDWVRGQMEGQGIFYWENGETYRGGWSRNKKNGSGRYEYSNGDIYIGEWVNDKEDGLGTMNYANGNIFEGLFVKGKKEGPGLFFYASTKKVYQGEWFEDQPQCGEFRPPNAEEELRLVRPLSKGNYYNEFTLPVLGLDNPRSVVDMAISEVRVQSLNKSFVRLSTPQVKINTALMDTARVKFYELTAGQETVSIYEAKPVFTELGLNVTSEDIDDIIEQLQLSEMLDISFTELVELASYIHEQRQEL